MLPPDTIIAVSSPPGRSARGTIRIAGPRAFPIADALFDSPFPRTTRALIPVRLAIGLPALACGFASPHSYTGDDLLELQLPGNPALLDRVLHAALAQRSTERTGDIDATVRLAHPGEFTLRAYLAGKLDLTQAEGVAATIAAATDSQLAAASLLRAGRLGGFANQLVDALAGQLALVEAGIDFTDQDDVVPIAPASLDANLATIESRLTDLLARSRSWGALEALPRVVLVGAPSTGKSTLFNALLARPLGRPRAVVSPTPGTTRDLLAEPLTLTTESGRRVEVMLIDIAGLDSPTTALDRDVQATARRAIETADLLLLIHDHTGAGATAVSAVLGSSATPDTADTAVAHSLRIRTKSDFPPREPLHADLAVSAVTGENLDALRSLIAARVGERGVGIAGAMLALQPRHETALRAAAVHLASTRRLLAAHRSARAIAQPELVATGIRLALDELACLGGEMTPDDVIGRVFATFCVGK